MMSNKLRGNFSVSHTPYKARNIRKNRQNKAIDQDSDVCVQYWNTIYDC